MASDARAQQAREHHRAAASLTEDAARHRVQRDELVHQLYRDGWSYGQLAKVVGCSPELIAKIINPQRKG